MTSEEPKQLLRVLLHSDNALQIEIRHGAGHSLEKSAKHWGMVLADVIRHLSYAYERTDQRDTELVRQRVMHYLKEDLDGLDPDHTIPSYKRFDSPGG